MVDYIITMKNFLPKIPPFGTVRKDSENISICVDGDVIKSNGIKKPSKMLRYLLGLIGITAILPR